MDNMTLEEALAAATVDDTSENRVLVIDSDLRTIEIPGTVKNLGVESDDDVHRLYFQMPKTYGEFDLSEFDIRINYKNGNVGDVYAVEDKTVEGDVITFSWLVGRNAVRTKGATQFIVCLKKSDASGVVQQEFNTTVASLNVLEGLEITEQVVQENTDIIEQILKKIDGLTSISPEDIANAVEEYMEKNPQKDVSYEPQELTEEQKAQARKNIDAEASGTAESKVSEHNVAIDSHNDIRLLVQGLTERLNALADSDDTTLDQMSEVVAYIKSNKSLIDAITTSKINVSDIIDNLTTNASNKPLSAAQGVVLKAMIEEMGSTTEGDVIDVDAELKAYMQTVKPDMVSAIVEKGGTASESDAWGDFPDKVRAIPNGVSATESLPEQTALIASILSTGGIGLNWKDTGATGYLIIRKTGGAPENTADGTIVYNGGWKDTVTDTDVTENVTYYYRIFPYNSSNQYQAFEGESVKSVTYKDRSGELRIADVEVGDKILFGAWGTTVQSWTVCDTQDKESGFVTVCLDNPAGGNRYFDAPETNNPVSNRASQGNNRWAYSNIRQWLNSDGAASEWFVAQHDYDVRPSYYNNKGWLADFTDYEKGILVPHKSKCILDQADGGGSETVYDKMFLASSYAMGLEIIKPLEDEHMYELFTDNASRSFSSNFWLRTINGTTSASSVRVVGSNGGLYSGGAANSYGGAARPFCELPTSAYIVWSDSDSAYVFADDSQRNG